MSIECTVVEAGILDRGDRLDIIVGRVDEYSDTLAAVPLADVLDAPILLNPSDELDPRVATEIQRLAAPYAVSGPAMSEVSRDRTSAAR